MVQLTDEEFEALKAVAATGISRTRDVLREDPLTARAQRVLLKRIEDARAALSKLADFNLG